jgi:hypothetical protein
MNSNPLRRTDARLRQTGRRAQNGSGNVRQRYERYLVRAREAQLAGDEIEMENCYQHAEHYYRLMRAAGAGM